MPARLMLPVLLGLGLLVMVPACCCASTNVMEGTFSTVVSGHDAPGLDVVDEGGGADPIPQSEDVSLSGL